MLRAMRFLALVLCLTACAAETVDSDHEEPADFEVDPEDAKADGLPATFDQNFVVTDALLIDSLAMSVEDVQTFFEANPYGTRSWLASYQVGGVSAAEMVVEAAVTHEINPVILIARMQVETSLVSKTTPVRAWRCNPPSTSTPLTSMWPSAPPNCWPAREMSRGRLPASGASVGSTRAGRTTEFGSKRTGLQRIP